MNIDKSVSGARKCVKSIMNGLMDSHSDFSAHLWVIQISTSKSLKYCCYWWFWFAYFQFKSILFLADFYVLNSPSSLVRALHISGWTMFKWTSTYAIWSKHSNVPCGSRVMSSFTNWPWQAGLKLSKSTAIKMCCYACQLLDKFWHDAALWTPAVNGSLVHVCDVFLCYCHFPKWCP